MDYPLLISFALATLALAISPGPDNIFVLVQSMAHGRRYGLATTAGLMAGCLVHTTLLAFGASTLIRASPNAYLAIKVFGAVYLLYLAFMVFRNDSDIVLSGGAGKKKKLTALFRQGFIMNVLNPKVTMFFLAFFPGFLFSQEMNTVLQFYILGFLFIVFSSVVFGGIAILSGSIGAYLKRSAHIGSILKWVQILVFAGIALYLLFG